MDLVTRLQYTLELDNREFVLINKALRGKLRTEEEIAQAQAMATRLAELKVGQAKTIAVDVSKLEGNLEGPRPSVDSGGGMEVFATYPY